MEQNSIVLYGCGYEADKFIIKHPDVKIDYCIDDVLHGQVFHNYPIYKPEDKKDDLLRRYVVIFTNNLRIYEKISNTFKAWGLKNLITLFHTIYMRKRLLLPGEIVTWNIYGLFFRIAENFLMNMLFMLKLICGI